MDKAAAPRASLGTAPSGFRPCPPLPLQNIPGAARGQLRAVAHRPRLPPIFKNSFWDSQDTQDSRTARLTARRLGRHPSPTANQNEKAQRLDAIGGSTINDVAEGGTVAATCYPCPLLRHSVSRSRSAPTSPRRGARRTHPHGGHLRALISRYSASAGRNERHRRDHDAAGIAWRGPTPLVGVGNTQGRRPRSPPKDGRSWGPCLPPRGGLVFIGCPHLRKGAVRHPVEDVRRKIPKNNSNICSSAMG
uniref:Uncharacterized protein n=1 Tax=uncultured prokaryote TaxID=198431 RepID=A0A0H5PYZ4_9ZZZZ|nr:hypothetical protein [uncultured prokaryote]